MKFFSLFKRFFIVILLIFLFVQKGYPYGDRDLYYQAIQTAQSGNTHFAFMYFRRLLREFPESRFFEDSLFTTGEYYFLIDDYFDAKKTFEKFINDYPESRARLFALTYLLKIAEDQQRQSLRQDLEKQILKLKQIVLLFKDFEEYEYTSPLSKKYKAIYFIDRIEIYIDDDLFTKISF